MIDSNTEMYFSEIQRFRQPLLWIFFGVVSLLVLFGLSRLLARYLAAGKTVGKSPLFVMIFVSFMLLAVAALLFFARMETQVSNNGLFVRFFPFHFSFHRLPLEQLQEYQVITFSPIKDYGGWGIRVGNKGKAYIVSGNRGVLLIWPNKKICLGSQYPEQLAAAINRWLTKHHTLPPPITTEKKEGE